MLPWICSFSLALAWKVATRRSPIGMASPVRGLRPGPRRLDADLEVAEARDLDVRALDQAVGDQVEEGFDHVLGLALVQADLLEQQVGQMRLGQAPGFRGLRA